MIDDHQHKPTPDGPVVGLLVFMAYGILVGLFFCWLWRRIW